MPMRAARRPFFSCAPTLRAAATWQGRPTTARASPPSRRSPARGSSGGQALYLVPAAASTASRSRAERRWGGGAGQVAAAGAAEHRWAPGRAERLAVEALGVERGPGTDLEAAPLVARAGVDERDPLAGGLPVGAVGQAGG